MRKKAAFLSLIPIIYFSVSGGPYGLEEIVKVVGPFHGLLFIILIPLVWSIPEALIVGELSSNYPLQGGYYKWVQRALGNFWGFLEGWWSIIYSLIDLSIYPVLVCLYLKLLFPEINPWQCYLVQLFVIWGCALINILGIRVVGNVLAVLQFFIFALFIIFVLVGAKYISFDFSYALHKSTEITKYALLFGLSVTFWNYIGLDGVSTVLGEIENPSKNYYKAVLIVVPLIVCFYFFPILVGVCIHQDWKSWDFGEYTHIAQTMNLKWLAIALIFGGMITFTGLFNSLILTSTRVLSTMSKDGYLPDFFSKLHKKSNAPYLAIIFSAFMYSLLVLIGFHSLVVYDVFFFLIAMLLEIISLIILRKKTRKSSDGFKIPFGNIGMYTVTGLACLTITFMILLNVFYFCTSPSKLLLTLFLLLSGIPVYFIYKKRIAS